MDDSLSCSLSTEVDSGDKEPEHPASLRDWPSASFPEPGATRRHTKVTPKPRFPPVSSIGDCSVGTVPMPGRYMLPMGTVCNEQ